MKTKKKAKKIIKIQKEIKEIIDNQNQKYRFLLIGIGIVMIGALLYAGQLGLILNATFYVVTGLAGLVFLLINIGIVFQMIIFVIFAGMFFVILEKILRHFGLIF
tara:strand:- start:377 stop:691 length:315 start_codon:yes stop_codon:yes gene_type:complete